MLKNWPVDKAYFQRIAKTWCFIAYNSGESSKDASPIPLLCLEFLQNCLLVFQTAILKLEGTRVIAVEVSEILSTLRDKLLRRIADKFFRSAVGQAMKKVPNAGSKKKLYEEDFAF